MSTDYDSIGNVGMMDKCYFTGKSDLINWLNSYFSLNVSKIEDCASGAIYCQIADAVYYYQVPMKNVNWGVKRDFQFLHNYKLLQQVFGKVKQPKYIDINKLIKGKYQDNLAFLQWMKGLFDESGAAERDYDAIGRRSLGKGPFPEFAGKIMQLTHDIDYSNNNHCYRQIVGNVLNKKLNVPTRASYSSNIEIERLTKTLNKEIEEKDIVDKERMFYFNKLRAIEILCETLKNQKQSNVSLNKISDILYDSNDIDLEVFSREIDSKFSKGNSNELTSTSSGIGEFSYIS
ncbi:EB1 protein [Cryptosporidium andersoni]|uniref:EB1 protein n=1 Tax=Cryptosporidium andersoni TaxID=117008 RepID=A0A1J4MS10_9CRYT|nr:EB1 protein [Cryptosporidium andersoni]